MREKNDILQRMLSNNLTPDEKKGYSEVGKHAEDQKNKPAEPRKVKFELTKEEKLAIFLDIKDRVVKGVSAEDIGRAVVACMQDYLKEKEDLAYNADVEVVGKGAKGGGFTRVQ